MGASFVSFIDGEGEELEDGEEEDITAEILVISGYGSFKDDESFYSEDGDRDGLTAEV